jgi:pimeloyl-ACP methyl ester carboxylesterase
VRFNFSGSGVGADRERFTDEAAFFANSPSRELEDVERVRAWLESGAAPEVDARRLALLGHSLGGGVGLIHAARRGDYRALVGWSSVATFRRFPPEVEALWRRQGFVEIPNLRTKEILRLGPGWLEDLEHHGRALDVLEACRRLTTPTLLLHGTEDEAVPLHEGRALAEALAPGSGRLELVEGANHTFWAAHPLAGVPATLERVLQRTAGFLEGELGLREPARTS